MPHFLVLMGGTAAAVLTLSEVRTRTKLIKVGATAALTYFLMTWATGLWQDQPLELVRSDSFWRAGWGLMAGFFLGGACRSSKTPWESSRASAFSSWVTTRTRCSRSWSAAPRARTTTRSRWGPSPSRPPSASAPMPCWFASEPIFTTLARCSNPTISWKTRLAPTSRHAKLAPAMSTLIIIGHVKDGVDLGRQHHLPEPIIDLIEQHHGTTLVEFFYHEANRRNGANPDASPVSESAYRYPGPKPQTKEAAILMIADAAESASRSLSDPTPSRLEGLVQRIESRNACATASSTSAGSPCAKSPRSATA